MPFQVFQPLFNPQKKRFLSTTFCLLGLIFKFWLIAHSEISDDTAPDDSPGYLYQIETPFQLSNAYGPGTGFFGRLLYEFGIPFRLGIEITFLLACFLAIKVILESPTKNYLSCTLYILAILDPSPPAMFRHILSDDVWLVSTLLGISFFSLTLLNPIPVRKLYLLFSILFLGLAVITRTTFILVFATILSTGSLTAIIASRKADISPLLTGLKSTAILLLGISTIYYAICYCNQRINGYFGLCIVDCTQFRDFYMSLESVGNSGGYPHYPVDENRRRLISQAGPTSRAFIEKVEEDTEDKNWGKLMHGRYDINLCMIYAAIYKPNQFDFRKSCEMFKKIEAEISDAGKRGIIPTRFVLPLPDGRLGIVAGQMPESINYTLSRAIFVPATYSRWEPWSTNTLKFTDPAFSKFLTRRSVAPSQTREVIGLILCKIYAFIYTWFLMDLYLITLAASWIFLVLRLRQPSEFHLAFLAKQPFNVLFVILVLWYALLNASGVWATPRYVIFCQVLLPVLLVHNILFISRCLAAQKNIQSGIEGAAPSPSS